MGPTVTQIKIEMVVDGKRREMIFRKEKIAELLEAQGSIGGLLRAFRDAVSTVGKRRKGRGR
jgi:hypothetical protein